MGGDSQNKKRKPVDKVSIPASHNTLSDTEKKLNEARCLFSLREFIACEALLIQILEADPLNSKAKALSELTAIKLHKHKLYRKLVEPRPARKLLLSSPFTKTRESASGEPESSPQIHRPASPAKAETEVPGGVASPLSGSDMDTMRERTIAALVELFNEKEKKLEDWRDPRFQPTREIGQEGVDQTGGTSPAVNENEGSLATPSQSLGRSGEPRAEERERPATFRTEEALQDENVASRIQSKLERPSAVDPLGRPLPAAKPSPHPLEIVEEIRQLKHEPPLQSLQGGQEPPLTSAPESLRPPTETADRDIRSPVQHQTRKRLSAADEPEIKPTIRLHQVSPFEQITSPRKVDYKDLVEKKLEEHSEDLKNSEIKTISIAEIKKYLYQEQYELCARELENIQKLFPDNAEIQAFVENTSRRLNELQRVKGFETLAKELMLSASFHYQQGKLPEALIATKEVLRVIPDHPQARQFAEFIQKRLDKEKKKAMKVDKIRYCWACGVAVDTVSQYCYHCGHRLG